MAAQQALYLTYSSSSWITAWKQLLDTGMIPPQPWASRQGAHTQPGQKDLGNILGYLGKQQHQNPGLKSLFSKCSFLVLHAEPLVAASQILTFQLNISWATTIKITIWKLQNHLQLQEIPTFHRLKEKNNLCSKLFCFSKHKLIFKGKVLFTPQKMLMKWNKTCIYNSGLGFFVSELPFQQLSVAFTGGVGLSSDHWWTNLLKFPSKINFPFYTTVLISLILTLNEESQP